MNRFKILLVDDEPYALKSLQRTLRNKDYEIFMATSANDALDIMKSKKIDLIITDEHMPGLSGTDLLEMIKKHDPDIIRIMITGMNDIKTLKDAVNRGEIYRFFGKPWDDFELLTTVRQAFKQRLLESENSRLRDVIKTLTLTSRGTIRVNVNSRNEEIKKRYFQSLKNDLGYPETLLSGIGDALRLYDDFIDNRDYALYGRSEAVTFKEWLQKKSYNAKSMSIITICHHLRYLKDFMTWLSHQPEHKSKIGQDGTSYMPMDKERVLEAAAPESVNLSLPDYVRRLTNPIHLENDSDHADRRY